VTAAKAKCELMSNVISSPRFSKQLWVILLDSLRSMWRCPLAAVALLLTCSSALQAIPILVAPCGGSRASLSTWTDVETGITSSAHLRGSTYAEVMMIGPGQAAATWVSGMMFGTISSLGNVRVRIADDNASTVAINSLDPSNPAFFPAIADQTLYWEIDVLDASGFVTRTLRNTAPMNISAQINGIPPYGTPFPIEQEVVFYDVTNLAQPVVKLNAGGSAGVLNNPGGLDVMLHSLNIDWTSSEFTTTWVIRNTTGNPLDIHWFATGIHGVDLQGLHEQYGVSLNQQISVAISGSFHGTDPLKGLVLHATSAPGQTEAEGQYQLYLNAVPEPSTVILMCAGLVGLLIGHRRYHTHWYSRRPRE